METVPKLQWKMEPNLPIEILSAGTGIMTKRIHSIMALALNPGHPPSMKPSTTVLTLSGGAYTIVPILSLSADSFYVGSILEVGLCLNLCVFIRLDLFLR